MAGNGNSPCVPWEPLCVPWEALCVPWEALRRGLLILVLTLRATSPAEADDSTWSGVQLPTDVAKTDGFTCQLQWIHPDGEGYLPLRFRAQASNGKFPGDRLVQIHVTPAAVNFPKPDLRYVLPCTLPAGQASFETTFYLPKYFIGRNFTLEIHGPAGLLEGYGARVSDALPLESLYLLSPSDIRPRLAVILPQSAAATDSSAFRIPDLRVWDDLFRVPPRVLGASPLTRASNQEALRYLSNDSLSVTQLLDPLSMHDQWLGYEGIEIVLAPFPLLEEIAKSSPLKFEALRQWLSTGGILWTYAIPNKEEFADFFDVSLPPPPETPLAPLPSVPQVELDEVTTPYAKVSDRFDAFVSLVSEPWQRIVLRNSNSPPGSGNLRITAEQLQSLWQSTRNPVAEPLDEKAFTEILQPLPVEAGMVVGMQLEDPFPGSMFFWHAVSHWSGPAQYFELRRGTSLVRGSSRYWDWLLKNVALPPVKMFLGLLTVFVLLVGPVAFQLSRFLGRNYLMFIIPPVLACITTLALFGYGFIADGFGTQYRARQITWLDSRSQRAARMSRTTYFAAFGEQDGLRFASDTAVYPLLDDVAVLQQKEIAAEQPNQEFRLSNDGLQRFVGDVLPARTQRQFLSFRPLPGEHRVQVRSLDAGRLFENLTAMTFSECLLHTQADTYLFFEGRCAPQQSIALQELTSIEASRMLRKIYLADQPATLLGYNASERAPRTTLRQIESVSGYLLSRGRSWSGGNDTLGVFEARLKTMLLDSATLPVGWFVGRGDPADDASAVEGGTSVDSVHYVIGSLP